MATYSENFFYSDLSHDYMPDDLRNEYRDLSNIIENQIFLLDRPLVDEKYKSEFEGGCIVLSPGRIPIIFNCGLAKDDFEEYTETILDDLTSLSDKYNYKKILPRIRKLYSKGLIKVVEGVLPATDYEQISEVEELSDKRVCDLIVSLLTGSINSSDKISIDEPVDTLDSIKKKIVLFDGDQTRFIYGNSTGDKKVVKIQGMSGTGKTELLLHKLRELYVRPEKPKVFFTCHSKTLADSINKRIPPFFNLMKVEEQIQWNERLFCTNAWGSQRFPNSGLYSYICDFYEIPFYQYSKNNQFSDVCRRAINDIENSPKKGLFAIDYLLVDESQDLDIGRDFSDLCKLVTKNEVIFAGDIFQSIFDSGSGSNPGTPDFLLRKCYRTDPRTFMFSHALSLGMFENPRLKWLTEQEFNLCGYITRTIGGNELELTRSPVRRFEDVIESDRNSIFVDQASGSLIQSSFDYVVEKIEELRGEYPSITPNDLAVIFLDDAPYIYEAISLIKTVLLDRTGWEANSLVETKCVIEDKVTISNRNNIKGLEFPFVICVTGGINSSIQYRNSLYTMLTRSFISSYLLVGPNEDASFVSLLQDKANEVKDKGKLLVKIPTADEIVDSRKLFENDIGLNIPVEDIVDSLLVDYNKSSRKYIPIRAAVKAYLDGCNFPLDSKDLENASKIASSIDE